jgi:uncharacterized integral membrane protein
MRLVWICLIVLSVLVGIVFGAFNGEAIGVDFYFATVNLPKGAALLCALLLGWIAGGAVVYFGLVLRLRRQLRAARREGSRTPPKPAPPLAPPADAT